MRPFALVLIAAFASNTAWADGKRDLEDGIAFYENLDTDRAMDRLTRASKAKDLGPSDRAKAFLYLGMLQFEIGSTSDAKKSWTEALQLDRNLKIPDGTSPKTIEAIEEVRAKIAASPGGPKVPPPPPPPPPSVEPPPPPPPPSVEPPPPPPSSGAITEVPPAEEDGTNTWLWVGVGAGAAVVVAVIVVVAVVATGGNGSECDMGGGGCLGVSFR